MNTQNHTIESKKISREDMGNFLMNEPFEHIKNYLKTSYLSQEDINHFFYLACNNGKYSLVEYLLTSPELSIHADIHYNDDCVIHCVTEHGYSVLVKYLLTSPNLKEHIYIEKYLDDIFENSLENLFNEKEDYYGYHQKCTIVLNEDVLDTLNYLIYEYRISPTENIINLLKKFNNDGIFDGAFQQLNNNLLYSDLSRKLNEESFIDKKIKVKSKI